VPHFSSFKIHAYLHVQADTTDPNVKNVYLLWLSNVKHQLYNGPDTMEKDVQQQLIPDQSLIIQDPFMAFYAENNLVQIIYFVTTIS
jgi:hypothetical protein